MFGHAQTKQELNTPQSRDRHVKDMVRKMVLNLEGLQDNLQQVVGDLKTLVEQIDSVTAKIDKIYGTKWRRKERWSHSPHSPPNIPIKTVSEEVSRHLLRVEEVRACDASPDLDLSYLQITPGEHRSRWGRSLVFSDPLNIAGNAERTPKRSLSLGTDMADYSGTSLQDFLQQESTNVSRRAPQRSISVNTDMTDNSAVSVQTCVPVSVTKCFAQIKHDVVEEEVTQSKPEIDITPESKTSTKSDVICAINTPPDHDAVDVTNTYYDFGEEAGASASASGIPYDLLNSKFVNVDSSSEHGSYSSGDYDGMYELLMETQLENLTASSDYTDQTESSAEYNMDLGSLDKSDTTSYSDDIEVRYDRDINTWTSYTLAHMNSSERSSDSCLSETPSDILNDNTQATITYGNMIFSDQLVVLNSRKHRRKRLQRDQNTNQAIDIP